MALYPIHEAYFGKTPEILALADQFSKFRRKYVTGSIFKYSPTINTDEDLIKFNRMMEDTFGFQVFELYIINSTQVNAYTHGMTETRFEKVSKALIRTKDGIKYDTKYGFCCLTCIYTGLLLNNEYTDDEIFAIILHEIGHNFQESLVKDIKDLNILSYVFSFITAIINAFKGDFNELVKLTGDSLVGRYIKNIRAAGAKFTRNKGAASSIINYFATFKNVLSDTFLSVGQVLIGLVPFSGLLLSLIDLPTRIINTVFNLPRHVSNVAGEYLADSFAVMYGYGPETASAQRKINNATTGFADEAVQKTKVLNAIYQFNLVPILATASMFDEHPSSLARVKNTVDSLEKELQNENLDPKMKKKIIEDAKKCKKEFDEFYKQASSLNPEQKKVIYNGSKL